MPLSKYHENYAARTDEELAHRAKVKKEELKKIFEVVNYKTGSSPVRVAVLGCADRRFVQYHKEIFESLLSAPVELTTFDITVEHLGGENGVIQHDCSVPLPNPSYDITFGHVLLKFIETEKQYVVLKNSYAALRSPGLAIHVFDEEDVTTKTPRQADGYYAVPLERWKEQLAQDGIKYKELRWVMDPTVVPFLMRSIKGGALILIRK